MKREDLRCIELLKFIGNKLEKNANSDLQKNDITISQFEMLLSLHFSETGRLPLKELERYFGVAQSTAAGIAVRLEKKGLIESAADKNDKRVKLVSITEKGRSICENSKKAMIKGDRLITKELTPQERKEFKRLLQKICNSLE